jgi:hypothetical protein
MNKCFTFKQGLELLEGKDKLKLEAATWLIKIDEDTLGIKLQKTVIIYIFRSGIYQYDTGGWKDRLTLERLNKYGPRLVYTDGGVNPNWLIGEVIFYDGVRMDHTGDVLNPKNIKKQYDSKKRRLQRKVRQYIAGYKQHVLLHGLDIAERSEWAIDLNHAPIARSAGDCWACYFGTNSDHELKEPLGVSHLIEHMNENDYVPSLLWKAIVATNVINPQKIWEHVSIEAKMNKAGFLDKLLTGYFQARKHLLLELID